MNDLILSVVVPVYNPKTEILQKCLSCFDEKDDRYEVLLVNDGCAESTGKVLYDYAKDRPWVRVISQENAGVSAARNHGIEKAEGRWITFCDADDTLSIQKALEIISDQREAEYVYTSYEKIRRGKRETVRLEPLMEKEKMIRMVLNVSNLYGTVWAKFCRRDLLDKYGIRFHTDLSHAEDTVFILEYLNHVKKIGHADTCFYQYHVYEDSATKQNPKAIDNYCSAMEHVLGMYQNTAYEAAAANFCIVNLLVMMVHYIWKKGTAFRQGKEILEHVLEDKTVKKAFAVYDPASLSKTSRLMAFLLKHHCYRLCYLACHMR